MKNLYTTLFMLLAASATLQAQYTMEVQSIRHDFKMEGDNVYEELYLVFDNQGQLSYANVISDAYGGIQADETYTYNGNTITAEMKSTYIQFGISEINNYVYQLENGRIKSITGESNFGDKEYGTMTFDSFGRLKSTYAHFIIEDEPMYEYTDYFWSNGNLASKETRGEENGDIEEKITFNYTTLTTGSRFLRYIFGGVTLSSYISYLFNLQLVPAFHYGLTPSNLVSECEAESGSIVKSKDKLRFEYTFDAADLLSVVKVYTNEKLTDTYNITWQSVAVGIEEVNVDENIDETWFTADGRATNRPGKGLFINKGRKILR